MIRKFFILFLFLAFAVQLYFHGQSSERIQPERDQKAFQYEVTVALKLVQVFVTDKEGNPVMDLTKDDFILHDNGKLQTITDFEKHLLSPPKKLAVPEKKVEERLEETQLPPSQEVQTRMNRKFILFVDRDRNSMRGVVLSKKAALHFIDTRVQPDDEVAVFSYSSQGGLIIHEYLTSDHQKAREAVKRIKGVMGGMPSFMEGGLSTEVNPQVEAGEQDRVEVSQKQAQTQVSRGYSLDEIVPGIQTDAAHRTNIFINDMKDIAKVLRYIPGYKNIIFFSSGVPWSLLYSKEQTLRENYEEMAQELASASSPVYTVSTNYVGRIQSLDMLSEISGGKYLYLVDKYENVATQIQNITSNYYVLGYYIDEAWDGKFHKIKVDVKRKGYEVQAQSGYFNPKPFVELSEFEKEVHLIEMALSENPYLQDPYSLNNIALACSEEKEANCVLLSEIPLKEIEEIITGKTEHSNFILDSENNVIFSTKGDIDFSSFSKERIYSYSILSLPPGKYDCRTIIRNLQTGKVALASSPVEIPFPLQKGLRLDSPLFLIPERESTYLRLIKGRKKDPLSINNVYPLLSNRDSPLIGELDRRVSKLLAVVRCVVADIQKPEVNIAAYIIEKESGNVTELSLSILNSERKENTDNLLLEIQLPELKPGEYAITISAIEINTKSTSEVNTDFSVR